MSCSCGSCLKSTLQARATQVCSKVACSEEHASPFALCILACKLDLSQHVSAEAKLLDSGVTLLETRRRLWYTNQTSSYAGTFEGDDVTHYGGLATFQATYGTAKGSHSVTGESIRCESDSSGVFVVSFLHPQTTFCKSSL